MVRSMRWLRLALLGASFASLTVHARASSCIPAEPGDHLAAADVVFLGRAVKATAEQDTVFEVERVYKGDVPRRVTVRFHRVKYAFLPPPGRYLVYGSLEHTDGGIELTSPVCSGSGAIDGKTEALSALGVGNAPKGPLASGKGAVVDAGAVDPGAGDAGAGDAGDTSSDGAGVAPLPPEPAPPSGETLVPVAPLPPSPQNAGGCAACVASNAPASAAPLPWFVAATLSAAFAWRRRRARRAAIATVALARRGRRGTI